MKIEISISISDDKIADKLLGRITDRMRDSILASEYIDQSHPEDGTGR